MEKISDLLKNCYRAICKGVVVLLMGALLGGLPADATAQSAGMGQLEFLTGSWEGTGWILLGPEQREEFHQIEEIYWMLNGEILVIEGRGYLDAGHTRPIHNAYAVINYLAEESRFVMRAWREGGYMVDPEVEVVDGTMIWTMRDPRAGLIRYKIWLNEEGQWVETGHSSWDGGNSWFQFFEMTLDRKL